MEKNKKYKKQKIWFYVMTISSLIYIAWRLFFTIPFGLGTISLVMGILLVSAELISVLESVIRHFAIGSANLPKLPLIAEAQFPEVDVLIATHSEDEELLYKTINGCKYMDYPNKSKVHIYVCDDNNRIEIKKLADKMGVGYFGLSDNKYAKAGNLNNALSKISSPLVVTLDADMIPKSEFLKKTIPYFFLPKVIENEDGSYRMRTKEEIDEDYKIGFIQTPQTFYNSDLFQFNLFAENNIPNEQDYFFKEINVSRNNTNSPIYAGSNTVISKQALIDVKGIRTGTVTEDFATGIDIQSKGYTCYAIPDVLASGLVPTTFVELLKQRIRWGRGCVQTLRSFAFLRSKLSFAGKLNYLGCLLYWTAFSRRIIYILSPILYSVFGVISVDIELWQFLLIGLPTYLIYNKGIKVLSNGKIDFRWNNIVDTIIAPYLMLPIFFETIGLKMNKFHVTEKKLNNQKDTNYIYAIPNLIFLIASIIGIYFVINGIIIHQMYVNIIILFWLIINSYFLLMASIFMIGRTNFRNSERFYEMIPLTYYINNIKIEAMTTDLSETGLSFITDSAEFIDYSKPIKITITDRKYEAIIETEVIHVHTVNNRYQYHMIISNINAYNKSQYTALLYDRKPSFPDRIKTKGIDDLFHFIKKKKEKQRFSNRKLPRIIINKDFTDIFGKKFKIIDFNYQHFVAKVNNESDFLEFCIDGSIIVKAQKVSVIQDGRVLFEIEDWKEIAPNISINRLL